MSLRETYDTYHPTGRIGLLEVVAQRRRIVSSETLSHIAAGFGIGVALAGTPGPVQAILLGEALRGGIGRGFRTLAGANLTFGLLLIALALGLSVAAPGGLALQVLKMVGGGFLLWLAVDSLRSTSDTPGNAIEARRWAVPAPARGALAVLLNPGAWLFLGAVGSPLLGTATRDGGTSAALAVALALMVGAGVGDGAVVLLGGVAARKGGAGVQRWIRRVLAVVLAALGLWLLWTGLAAGTVDSA